MTTGKLLPTPQANNYRAGAVFFDGLTCLTNSNFVGVNNAFFSASLWVRCSLHSDSVYNFFNVSPPATRMGTTISDEEYPGMDFWMTVGSGSYLEFATAEFDITVWNHYLVSFDTGHVGTSKIAAVYINDVLHTAGTKTSAGSAFNHVINGSSLWIGKYVDDADMSDVRIMPGVSLLDGSGLIPEATRRLFIDANKKPVDPAIATAALGLPAVLLTGWHSTFATNQGTGGPFIMERGLKNSTVSPSGDVPPRYIAEAVRFDGSTWYGTNGFGVDQGQADYALFLSFWFKCDLAANVGRYLWITSPQGTAHNHGSFYANGWKLEIGNSLGARYAVSTGTGLTSNVWHSIAVNVVIDRTTGTKKSVIYLDDVKVTTAVVDTGPIIDFPMYGLPLNVGGNGTSANYIGELADFVLINGATFMDDATGDIYEEVRRHFRDEFGNPVDPTLALSDTTPDILLTGGAAGFATNRGFSGPLTLHGMLTDVLMGPSGPAFIEDPILDARIPLLHSGMSIAVRDTYAATDKIVVPLEYGGVSCRANELMNLPAHARIPLLNAGLTLSPAKLISARPPQTSTRSEVTSNG